MAEKDYKSYTENYNLIKPGDLEKYDIEEVTRTNADIIDAELKKHEVAIKNLHNYDDTEVKKNIEDLKKAQQSFTETIKDKADKTTVDDLVKLVQSMQVTTHRINVTTDIEENTEYELPCSYIVGSGDIEIYCNNEIMIRAVEGSWGNFAEVRSR